MTLDFAAATPWWVLAALLVLAELTTGTFFLLMLAGAAGAGALAAQAGAGLSGQLLAAAVAGGLGVLGWQRWRARQPAPAPQANRDLNLDIGEVVEVPAWTEDGRAEVQHRGASWQARHAGPDSPRPGPHIIVALEGNRLVLTSRR